MNTNNTVLLSKWWQTPSCAQAFARAEAKRAERLEKLKADQQAKREEKDREYAEFLLSEDHAELVRLNET